ncbi:MAG: hypothetical protein AAGB22_00005, partial [Bacteroidota bacterium]
MTLRQFANTRTFRITAATTGLAMLAQLWSPTVSFALTSGPAQPEASSFTPVEATNMVDLFTGDFNYNIHLLTVPGANGGYPINLGYSAGIGLEQEASWVGLGWNLNPGAVNRQMRGLPDDFKGDVVTKLRTSKPSYTVSLGVTKNLGGIEAFGFDQKLLKATGGISISYNNYTGTNLGVSTSFSAEIVDENDAPTGFFANLGLSLDEQNGLGMSPGVSYIKQQSGRGNSFNTSVSFASKQGLTEISLGVSSKRVQEEGEEKQSKTSSDEDKTEDTKEASYSRNYTPIGAGMALSYVPLPPASDFPRTGWSGQIEFNPGVIKAGITSDYDIQGSFTTSSLATNLIAYPAYGYLHSQDNFSPESLQDFQREKDVVATKSIRVLPMPVSSNDIFN